MKASIQAVCPSMHHKTVETIDQSRLSCVKVTSTSPSASTEPISLQSSDLKREYLKFSKTQSFTSVLNIFKHHTLSFIFSNPITKPYQGLFIISFHIHRKQNV